MQICTIMYIAATAVATANLLDDELNRRRNSEGGNPSSYPTRPSVRSFIPATTFNNNNASDIRGSIGSGRISSSSSSSSNGIRDFATSFSMPALPLLPSFPFPFSPPPTVGTSTFNSDGSTKINNKNTKKDMNKPLDNELNNQIRKNQLIAIKNAQDEQINNQYNQIRKQNNINVANNQNNINNQKIKISSVQSIEQKKMIEKKINDLKKSYEEQENIVKRINTEEARLASISLNKIIDAEY